MLLSTHALVGAVIGKNINNPWLIIILSIAVHFAMDFFRHGEYFDSRIAKIKNTWWKVVLDIAVLFLIIYFFIHFRNPDIATIKNIILGCFFSILPDGLSLLHWKFPDIKILKKIKDFHGWAHHYAKFPKHSPERQWTFRNALNDIFISTLAIILLFL